MNKTITVLHVIHAKTFQQKITGLLGTKKPYAIYFQTRFGIHTFFMKYPIDVVILDDINTVRKIKSNLKPWRVFFWNPLWQHVVELPSQIIVKKKIHIGEKIVLQ